LAQAFSANKSADSEVWLWHKHLGHLSFGYLKKLLPKLFIKLSNSDFKCRVCELTKSHRVPFQISMNKNLTPFMVIYSDVWGPANNVSLNDKWRFISFIDDHTRVTWICLMKSKSEVGSLFKQFHKMIATISLYYTGST